MLRPGRVATVALVALAVATLSAAPARADIEKCQKEISKQASKYLKKQLKALTKCEEAFIEGKVGACPDAETAAKIAKAATKVADKIAKACGGDDETCAGDLTGEHGATDLGWPTVCPDFQGSGCTNIINGDTCSGIATCMLCIEDAAADEAIDFFYGSAGSGTLGKDDAKCQSKLGGAGIKYALSREKALSKCWQARIKGDHSNSCPSPGDGKATGKIAKAATKLDEKIASACSLAENAAVLADYAGSGCPSVTVPAASSCTAAINDFDDIATCVECVADFDTGCIDLTRIPQFEDYRAECDPDPDCGDGMKSGPELCDPSDPTPANQVCPNSGNGLEACNPFDCTCSCPGHFDFVPDATSSDSSMDRGWTGFGHNESWISDGKITLEVTSCSSPNKPCGICSFSGPVPNSDADAGMSENDVNNQRCTNDTSTTCTSNSDCSGGSSNRCAFFLAPPLPLSNGLSPICVLQQIVGDITGSVDVSTGGTSVKVDVLWDVFVGDAPVTPCPECAGDTTPNDGIAGGLCEGGARHGEACDANGISPVSEFGRTSFDCPPDTMGRISGAGLPVNLDAITGEDFGTIAATSPLCRESGAMGAGQRCLCDTCADGATLCQNNADCVTAGAGSPCGGATSGEPTAPHDCPPPNGAPDGCEAGGGGGVCADTLNDTYCDGAVTSTGAGIIPCSTNGDCDLFSADCTAGCGNCTLVQARACFVGDGDVGDSIVGNGSATSPISEAASPTFASVTCVGPTSNAAVNAESGLPGPLRITLKGLARGLP